MKLLARIALIVTLAGAGGCVAAVGGAAYFAYEHLAGGWVGRKYEADFNRTLKATMDVLDEFKLGHGDIPRTGPKVEFGVKTDDEDVKVVVESVTAALTEVKFLVGFTGDDDEDEDEALSKRMLRKIDERLKR